jgi:hypothetical protein
VTTPQDLTIALDGVLSDYKPDDIESQSVTYLPVGGDANTAKAVTFGSSRSVQRGEMFSCVIRWTSTTGSVGFVIGVTTAAAPTEWWGRTYSSGSWSANPSSARIYLAFTWADDVNVPLFGTGFPKAITSTALSNATTPDEFGNRMRLPVSGVLDGFYTSAAHNTIPFDVTLYDDATNVIERFSFASGIALSGANTNFYFRLTKPLPVRAGQVVRVTTTPTSATTFNVLTTQATTNSQMALWGADIDCYATERTDGGAWTDTNNKRYSAGVAYGAIDDGTGNPPGGWLPQGRAVGEEPPIVLPG